MMTGGQLKGKILTQIELKKIFEAQQEKDWSVVQDYQLDLKYSLVENYRKNWQEFIKTHPDIKPVFDIKNPDKQEFLVSREVAERYNLAGHLNEFDAKSDNSTAGIRAFYDILYSENPSMMYNDLFLALIVDAETEFLQEVHQEIKNRLTEIEKDDPNYVKYLELIRQRFSRENLTLIEEIYGMPLEKIIPFMRDNIVKLVGGEVRAHTAKFVEMEARILAAKGVTSITMPSYDLSIPIYMHSFLSFVLGVTGATNYTPSHSSSYLFGRKVIAVGGGQLLPDKYENYRRILRRIIEEEIINGPGRILTIAEADSEFIKKTLSYDRMVKIYRSVLNVTSDDVKVINEATNKGHRIILNSLNGSTWKTLKPLLRELGIDDQVFELVYENEDPFFDVGYVVTSDKKSDGSVKYGIDHLGTDVSMTKVGTTIPYKKIFKGHPVGKKIYECDADSDRYCVKQLVENNGANRKLIADFGLDNYHLSEDHILVALSPNKMFLLLDVADYERMRDQGSWDDYYSLYLITYVSTRAWAEFGDAVQGMVKIQTRVGYKNLTEMQQLVENWYFNRPEEADFEFKDQVGNSVKINRSRKIRVHCKEEESGGRVAGTNSDCFSLLGSKTLAMPEKSDPDSLLSELTLSSGLYLAANGKTTGNYRLLEMMESVFRRYHLKSKIDARFDIMHGDQGSIALLPYKDQQAALKRAGDYKTNFNNFFFSLGRAVREGEINLAEVVKIMNQVLPEFSSTWQALESITLCDEPLSGGRTRPEGVPMTFNTSRELKPLVTEIDFRPSGTDPLKSKVYLDAETLSQENREKIEKAMNALTEYDLWEILERFKIKSVAPKPKEDIGLKIL